MTVTQDGDNDDDDDDDETDCKEERDDVDSGGRTVALTHARRWTTPHNYIHLLTQGRIDHQRRIPPRHRELWLHLRIWPT